MAFNRQSKEGTSSGLWRAAAVPVAALALAISGCHETDRYDAKTEAALKETIKPTMVRLAKDAVKQTVRDPDDFALYSAGEGKITVSAIGGNTDSNSIDIVMKTFPGTKKPNPNGVISVMLDSRTPNSRGLTNNRTIMLSAPGADNGNKHTKGWSASIVDSLHGIEEDPIGQVLDSSDKGLFSGENFNPTDPITTAQEVIDQTPETYRDTVAAFK